MKIIATIILVLMLTVGVGLAGSGWESDYDAKWTITVTNISGNTTVYNDSCLTNQGQFGISFIPDQMSCPASHGKVVRVNTFNTGQSVDMYQAD